MIDFDSIKQKEFKAIIDTAPKELKELAIELEDIQKYNQDPFFLALLIFKLSKEREETNKLIASIEEKYSQIIKMLSENPKTQFSQTKNEFTILSEQDQKILDFIEKNGMTTAEQIAKEFNYKKQNGASQRLNMLFKGGHLKKVRSGKKIFFLV